MNKYAIEDSTSQNMHCIILCRSCQDNICLLRMVIHAMNKVGTSPTLMQTILSDLNLPR